MSQPSRDPYGPSQRPGTRYCVDGFRSLRDFSVEIQPGLNVLVGPNGSGKSNFIDLLDFLYVFIRSGGPMAIGKVGGISRVFSQEILRRKSPKLSISVTGIAHAMPRPRRFRNGYYRYHYSLELRYSRAASILYVRSETLKLGRLRSSVREAQSETRYLGSMAISRPTINSYDSPTWEISPKLLTKNETNPMSITEGVLKPHPDDNHVVRFFDQMSIEALEPDRSFISEFSRLRFPAIDAVRNAMTRGRSFNVTPSLARAPDDLSKPPFIDQDGTGISSTLHHLQLLQQGRPVRVAMGNPNVGPDTLNEVIQWTKLIYPQMQDLVVNADVTSGKYVPYIVLKGPTPLRIPFQAASDGTIKWLVLVTVIVATGNTYSLEEPENFLHPKMQQFLIQLLREAVDDGSELSHYIVSTHSETLINEFTPEELIIFEFDAQKTSAKRVRNSSTVKEEINRTGFGLGHYFANNALS